MTTRARNKITVRQDSSSAGDDAPVYTGTAFASDIPARIDSVSGQETYRGRQLEAAVNYVVETRYMSGATPEMRITVDEGLFAGLTLHVGYVQHHQYKRGRPPITWFFCTAVV